MTAFFPL